MLCPFCKSEDTQVKDSRPSEDGTAIRRRRQCNRCDARFTTFERVQLREVSVIKRDGIKVLFDRDKLSKSFNVALRKRNIIQDKANAQIYMLLLRVTEEKKIKILLIFFYYASYCNKVYIYISNLFMANFKKFSLVPIKTL